MRIEGFIPATSDDGQLIGRKAAIALTRGNKRTEFAGNVVFVSPDVNPVNSMVRVFIEVKNDRGQLRPGLPVQASILLEEYSPSAEDAQP